MEVKRPTRRFGSSQQQAAPEPFRFSPHPGPQTKYFKSRADITLAGGGAGGGKSMALLMDALQGISHPGYEGAMFRKTLEMHRMQGGLWIESMRYYYKIPGALPNKSSFTWNFTGGASVKFYGCDKFKKYDGLQVAFLGLDQLEEFTAQEFWALQSRVRTVSGARAKVCATCNPEPGWLELFLKAGGYVGSDGYAIEEMDGVVRWFVRDPDSDAMIWGDSAEDFGSLDADGMVIDGPHCGLIPTSFTFIRFPLEANPSLSKKYRAKLQTMSIIERRKKLDGNWNQFNSGGGVYKRKWWGLDEEDLWQPSPNRMDFVPDLVAKSLRLCWAFDIGWSTTGDWTVGILFGQSSELGFEGAWWILDMIKFRCREHITQNAIRRCLEVFGHEVPLVLPHDPGKAGLDQMGWQLAFGALGYEVHLQPDDGRGGDKVARHRFMSPQAETGHVKLVTEWRPSKGVSLWLSQQETETGDLVECTTVDEFGRELVQSLDALSGECPHVVTDVTDAVCRGHRFMSGDDPAGDQRLADAMVSASRMGNSVGGDNAAAALMSPWSSNRPQAEEPDEGGDWLFRGRRSR